MLLVIDIGNSNITIGVYKEKDLKLVSRLATDRTITADQFAINIHSLFALNNIPVSEFSGAIISSVVPEITNSLKRGILKITGCTPLIVGSSAKTGLNVKLDNPSELGADLACTAVGAIAKYELPCIIMDFGTATKVTVIDEHGAFLGGAIASGIDMSLNALTSGTSLLSQISLTDPPRALGTNTADCIRSGIILGAADMVDGLIKRMILELHTPVKTIVSTGGFSKIANFSNSKVLIDDNLLLEGLRIIYEKNI
ncbi:MAG: type III pantothenate kinase [Ruminococcaceae bacterium]|nr:type III pantothenate kinase [Oscillospiraceae bacterium]